MRTDNVLRFDAMNTLLKTLGEVDAERFICMVKRDNFDYTEWQHDLWKDKSIEEIHEAATKVERVSKVK